MMEINVERLGTEVRKLREFYGLTQKNVAESADISLNELREIEHYCTGEISGTVFTNLAKVYGSFIAIFKEEGAKSENETIGELADAIGATLRYSIDSYVQCNELSAVAATVDQGIGILD
jgi:transcriptional regulator with XRE-family HTH domain